MQCLSHHSALALLNAAQYALLSRVKDVSKIFDNDEYVKQQSLNLGNMRAAQAIGDFKKFALQNAILKLEAIEASTLNTAIMHINKYGLLQTTDAFWMVTKFQKGMKFSPFLNPEDRTDNGIYLVEDSSGIPLHNKGINLLTLLGPWHIPYPTRVLWNNIESERVSGKRAFRLEFPERVHI